MGEEPEYSAGAVTACFDERSPDWMTCVVGGIVAEPEALGLALSFGVDRTEAGGYDAGIVCDKQIARIEQGGQIADGAVFEASRIGSADDEQPGRVSWLGGGGGDEFAGQVEFEFI